jgi:hypothetical protein
VEVLDGAVEHKCVHGFLKGFKIFCLFWMETHEYVPGNTRLRVLPRLREPKLFRDYKDEGSRAATSKPVVKWM